MTKGGGARIGLRTAGRELVAKKTANQRTIAARMTRIDFHKGFDQCSDTLESLFD